MNDKNNLPNKVLVIENSFSIASVLEAGLVPYNVKVDKASDLSTALYLFNSSRYDVVLIDEDFSELPGLVLVQKWRKHEIIDKRHTGFIIATGNKSSAASDSLIKELGDIETVKKPAVFPRLLPFLNRGLITKQRLVKIYELSVSYKAMQSEEEVKAEIESSIPLLKDKAWEMLCNYNEEKGNFAEALTNVQPLQAQNPDNIAYANACGRLLLKMGDVKASREFFEKADKLAPMNVERITNLIDVYIKENKIDKSVEKITELLKYNPDNNELKFEMYSKLFEADNEEKAVILGKQFSKPMEVIKHYNNKGVMLVKEGNIKQALKEYDRALKIHPKFKENYRIYYNIAIAKLQMQDNSLYSQVMQDLEECLRLSPEFKKAQVLLAKFKKPA